MEVTSKRDSDKRIRYLEIKKGKAKVNVKLDYAPSGDVWKMMLDAPRRYLPSITEMIDIVYGRRIDRIGTIELIDLITQITNIVNIESVDLIDLITTISEITNIKNLESVDLIDLITTISSITNVVNVESIDLIDLITTVSTISSITNIVNIEKIESIEKVRGLLWYDRSPTDVHSNWSATAVTPHAATERWSYTVPANKILFVESIQLTVIRNVNPSTDGRPSAYFVSGLTTLRAQLSTSSREGDRDDIRVAGNLTAYAGQILQGVTVDDSVGGSCDYIIMMKGTLFDV